MEQIVSRWFVVEKSECVGVGMFAIEEFSGTKLLKTIITNVSWEDCVMKALRMWQDSPHSGAFLYAALIAVSRMQVFSRPLG